LGEGDMTEREKIINSLSTIPSLPTAAVEAVRLLNNPEVSISKLTKTIEYDPALTSNILRMANSSYFGAPRQISSLKQAIVRLGTSNVFRLVVASAISPMVSKSVKGYDLPAGELWNHSIAVAICADYLGKALKIDFPGYIFTAGLLHDIGKVVLGNFSNINTEEILKIAMSRNASFDEAEMLVLGIDHAEIGALLLESWNLPKTISEIVRWHHYPEYYKGDQIAIALVHVANNLILKVGMGVGKEGLKYRISDKMLSVLNLTKDITEKVLIDTMDDLKELTSKVASDEDGGI